MKTSIFAVIVFTTFMFTTSAQEIEFPGKVIDAETLKPLPYANVMLVGNAKGTTSDKNGLFLLKLEKGKYTIKISFIGYKSAIRSVEINGKTDNVTFKLQPTEIILSTITVMASDTAALRIIRQVIANRQSNREKLFNYKAKSHTKATGYSVHDENTAQIDSGLLVVESSSDVLWSKEHGFTEEIKARKYSDTLFSSLKIWGVIQSQNINVNLSDDWIYTNTKVLGPISEKGLTKYVYRLKGETYLDSSKIFIIEIFPLIQDEPMIEGTLYIADNVFQLVKADVRCNDEALWNISARSDGRWTKHIMKQNFRRFENDIWMPVDIAAESMLKFNIFGIVQDSFRVEEFTVFQDYQINQEHFEKTDKNTGLIINKDADSKDSLYWEQNRLIPLNESEQALYSYQSTLRSKLDSMRTAEGDSNAYRIGNVLAGKKFRWHETSISVPGLIELHRFNRVEGYVLDVPIYLRNYFFRKDEYLAHFRYGTSDKRLKYTFGCSALVEPGMNMSVGATFFNRIGSIDEENDQWGDVMTSLASMIAKYDYKDYFYSKGWNVKLKSDVVQNLSVGAYAKNESYYDANKNSDWSLLRKSWVYRDNPPINEGSIFTSGFAITFDRRRFVDDQGIKERMEFDADIHIPTIGIEFNSFNSHTEQYNFILYTFNMNGSFWLNDVGTTSYFLNAAYTHDKLPTQRLLLLPGCVNYFSAPNRFRTLDFREFGGNQLASIFIDHNFGKDFFHKIQFPLLGNTSWGLHLLFNAGFTRLSEQTKAIQYVQVDDARTPFYEAGYALDNIFSFLSLEFAWRLNHFRDRRNFFFGFSTSIPIRFSSN